VLANDLEPAARTQHLEYMIRFMVESMPHSMLWFCCNELHELAVQALLAVTAIPQSVCYQRPASTLTCYNGYITKHHASRCKA
jgi:hypothetical protein